MAGAGAALLGCAPILPGPVLGQTLEAPDQDRTFEPDFFERFAPRTALDMLGRVPGFSVRGGNDERGLGQGGTNVLIGGERITAKGTGPLDILAQTPASSVVRIEIRDAAALGVTGLSGQVANVVLDRSDVSGNYAWRPEFREGLPARLTAGSLSVSGERGRLSYTLGVENDSFQNGSRGTEEVFDGTGLLTEARYED